jgi:hypothetical protein
VGTVEHFSVFRAFRDGFVAAETLRAVLSPAACRLKGLQPHLHVAIDGLDQRFED